MEALTKILQCLKSQLTHFTLQVLLILQASRPKQVALHLLSVYENKHPLTDWQLYKINRYLHNNPDIVYPSKKYQEIF